MKRAASALSLLLALLLVLSLSACDRQNDANEDGPSGSYADNQSSVNGPTALEILSSAIDATKGDLETRISASPLGDLQKLLSSPSTTAEYFVEKTSYENEEEKTSVTGSAVQNRDSGTAIIKSTYEPKGYDLQVYYSLDFAGVASLKLFGNDTFYGLDPKDMSSQLAGSAFSGLFSLDEAGLGRMDDFLSSVPDDAGIYSAGFLDSAAKALISLLDGRELTLDKTTLTRAGRELEGSKITASFTALETAGFIDKLADLTPESVMAYGIVSGDDSVLTFDETLDKLRSSASDTAVTFTVADGRLYHISASMGSGGSTYSFETEFYGDTGSLVSVTLEPVFSFTLELGNGVDFDMSTLWGYGSTTTLDWAADGKFDYITYSTDITTLALEGTLTASPDSASYDGIWFKGERGDRDALRVTVTSGGTVTPPAETKNIADLTSPELEKLILNLYRGI